MLDQADQIGQERTTTGGPIVPRATDFAQWYQDIIAEAELVDQALQRCGKIGHAGRLEHSRRQSQAREHPAHFLLAFLFDLLGGVIAGNLDQIGRAHV